MNIKMTTRAAAAGLIFVVLSASAHVGLAPREMPKGVTMTLAFGIGHGCGESPTIAVRMQIPAGVISVQPWVKPGWQIEVIDGTYATPQMRGTTQVTSGVTQINWTGGSLPVHLYDEFLIRARIADNVPAGTMIYFPVVQECANGVHRWISIPLAGQPEPEEPAPGLRVIDTVTSAGH